MKGEDMEERLRAIDANEMRELLGHRDTPRGFYAFAASTLQALKVHLDSTDMDGKP